MSRIGFVLGLACLLVPAALMAADDPAVQTTISPAQAGAAAAPAPQTDIEKTVAAIQEAAAKQIETLTAQLSDPAESLSIERQIEQIKFDAEVSIVRAVIADAIENGDSARRLEAEGALDRLLHPEKAAPAPVSVDRPAPKAID